MSMYLPNRSICFVLFVGDFEPNILTFHIIDASVPNLVFLACQEGPLDAQELYFATIKELCSGTQYVLGPALSALTYLNDRNQDSALGSMSTLESPS
jgi:hypothetical protein